MTLAQSDWVAIACTAVGSAVSIGTAVWQTRQGRPRPAPSTTAAPGDFFDAESRAWLRRQLVPFVASAGVGVYFIVAALTGGEQVDRSFVLRLLLGIGLTTFSAVCALLYVVAAGFRPLWRQAQRSLSLSAKARDASTVDDG